MWRNARLRNGTDPLFCETRSTCRNLMRKPVEGTPLGRLNPKCETDFKTNLRLMNFDDEHLIELAMV